MIIVDSHAHLNHPDFKVIESAIAQAKSMGVSYIHTICTQLEDFPGIIQIAESYDNVWCSVGVHPLHIEVGCSSDKMVELSSHPKVISIGETGLDYFYDKNNKEIQQNIFRQHIKAAQITGLPLVIHARDADSDIAMILQEEMKIKPFTGVLHCFTASIELAMAALEIGLYISASGIITFPSAEAIRQTFAKIPLDRLLVETDSPYLAPIPHRGKPNQPAFTRYVVDKLAEIRGLDSETIAKNTTDNFFRLFSKAKI